MDSEQEFYHSFADISVHVAEALVGLAAVAVGKFVVWPPLQYVLREKFDWPKPKRSKKPQNDVEMGNASDEAGGQKRARCSCEHEDFCSKIQPQEELSGGKQVYLTVKEKVVLSQLAKKIEEEEDLPGTSSQ